MGYKPKSCTPYIHDTYFSYLKVVKPLTYDGIPYTDKTPPLNIGDFTWSKSTPNLNLKHIEDNLYCKNFNKECFEEVTKEEYETGIKDKVQKQQMYRIKTYAELDYRKPTHWNNNGCMGYLYGAVLTVEESKEAENGGKVNVHSNNWRLNADELIKTYEGDLNAIHTPYDELKEQWIAACLAEADELDFDSIIDGPKSEYKIISRKKYMNASIAGKQGMFNINDDVLLASYNTACSNGENIVYKDIRLSSEYYIRIDAVKEEKDKPILDKDIPRYRVLNCYEYMSSKVPVLKGLSNMYGEVLGAICNEYCNREEDFTYKGLIFTKHHYKRISNDCLITGAPGYADKGSWHHEKIEERLKNLDEMEDIKLLKKDEGESDIEKPADDVIFTFRQKKKSNISIDDMDEIEF